MAPLFGGAEPFVEFWKNASWGIILWNSFEFGPVVQEEMLFKDISYLELWQPFCSAEQNHLCNFGRGCYEEQLWNYFEFGPMVQEMSFIRFLAAPLFSRTCAVFRRRHHEEHFCKVILNMDQYFKNRCLLNFLSRALAALLLGCEVLSWWHHEGQFCEIILNLGQWLRGCRLDISYLELWQLFCSAEWNHCPRGMICRIHIGDH